MATVVEKVSTARVKADNARIDRLKEQLRSTPQEIDFERVRVMAEVYEDTAGDQQILRRAKFLATLLDRKKLYIDDNLFVGSMASTVNGIYTYPEWNVDWMKEEKTVEKSKTPEDRKANEWALNYWDKRSLQAADARDLREALWLRSASDIQRRSHRGVLQLAGWRRQPELPPGLQRRPRQHDQGRRAAAEVARDAPAERLEAVLLRGVPDRDARDHPAVQTLRRARAAPWPRRNRIPAGRWSCSRSPRSATGCQSIPRGTCAKRSRSTSSVTSARKSSRSAADTPRLYLGQNLEPFYQRDKAAGLITFDDASFMFKNLVIKLNEIGYYYGERVALQNSADLGQSITLAGYNEQGGDATAEMDYAVLDACGYLALPQPPLSCALTEHTPGKFLEKVLDVIGTGVGMPQFVNADVMFKRALHLWGHNDRVGDLPLEKARRTCVGACVGSYIPYETGHPVEGQPNLGKILELTLNNGFDPRTKTQVGPKTGDPQTFKDFEELYAAFEKQLQFCEDTLRRGAWIASMLTSEFLPVTWRSILTKGCIETGTETWNGGANYYTVAQISVGGVDAANGLMAVKHLVYDTKKLTMAELKKALEANFEGEYEPIRKLCYEAPKHGNDIPEVNNMLRRVNDSILTAFNNVDGGGNYISKNIKTSLDQYTKSIHNLMGMVTGALPTGKKAGVALTDGSLSAMPGTDVKGPTALVMSAAKGNDAVKWCATHMNMKLPPDQLQTPQGTRQRPEPGADALQQRRLSHPVQRARHRDPQGRAEASRRSTATWWSEWPGSAPSSRSSTWACRTR